jgi:hypothetical protein
MEIQIINSKTANEYFFLEALCGKTSASVCIGPSGIRVICNNAMHKVWKGMGKHFINAEQAINNYKSSEMKEIIRTAIELKTI